MTNNKTLYEVTFQAGFLIQATSEDDAYEYLMEAIDKSGDFGAVEIISITTYIVGEDK